jgi:uncharacterized membrane protein
VKGFSGNVMTRRGYIDWLRGLAVLIMVEAHTIDAWTRASHRETIAFGLGGIVGGFAAPLFLFLAGVAVPLAIGAKVRRGASLRDAARAVRRRGWQVYGLALLFRLQAKLLGGGGWASILKVDILNIMGPAIVLAAAICGICRSMRTRLAVLGALVAATALATPPIRAAGWPAALPDFLEAYLRPVPSLTNFTWFPWSAFVLAGAIAGALLEPLRDEGAERRANIWFAAAGATLIVLGWFGSYFPSPYARSYFWTSSPAFFTLRVGILTLSLPLAFAWGRRSTAHRWSPMQQFGRTSLFVYWIHVEMAYGVLSSPVHRALTLWQWAIAYLAFVGFLLGLSVLKTRVLGPPRPVSRPAAAGAITATH